MQENDPTKSAFYDRCPLFGELGQLYFPFKEKIPSKKISPHLSSCLEAVNKIRNLLIEPFLQKSSLKQYIISRSCYDKGVHSPKLFTDWYVVKSEEQSFLNEPFQQNLPIEGIFGTLKFLYFNGDPLPDPKIVKKRIGFPQSLLWALRDIYWETIKIENTFSDFRNNPLEKAATIMKINEEEMVDRVAEIADVDIWSDYRTEGIDLKIIFRLLALHHYMSYIKSAYVFGESFYEDIAAAHIYLFRATQIDILEKEVVEKITAVNEKNNLEIKKRDRYEKTGLEGALSMKKKGERNHKIIEDILNEYPQIKSFTMFRFGRQAELREKFFSNVQEATKDRDPHGNIIPGDRGLAEDTIIDIGREILKNKKQKN